MRLTPLFALALALPCGLALAAEPPIPPVPDKQPGPPFPKTPPGAGVRMLMPGFTVRELPVKLTSLNNIEYAPDGRLFAGGYDGRFHLLRDTDGDGLEDKVDTFSPEPGANYPLGMMVKDGVPYVVLSDEVVRWRDANGDGVPDTRETVAKGFDDAELQIAQPGGAVAKLKKSDITKTEPMSVSHMPVGPDKALTTEELRDLMTYLLTEEIVTGSKPAAEGVAK